MQILRAQAFFLDGHRIPPLVAHGRPGDVWPAAGPLRLTMTATGRGGSLRALGAADVITFRARPVVAGVPGAWADITNTDDFEITAAAGETVTFDLDGTFLSRAASQYHRRFVHLAVPLSRPSGY